MAKFCTNCGATLDDDKKFCTECGAAVTEVQPAPPPRQTYTPPQSTYTPPQPAYTPQPTYGEAAPGSGSKYEPISTGGYIGICLLMCIPVVGLILTLVWACGGCRKVNKRNLARAGLVMMVIGLILCLVIGVAAKSLITGLVRAVEKETGYSLSDARQTVDNSASEMSTLSGLLNGLESLTGGQTGGEQTSDLQDLAELLEQMEGLTGEQTGGGDLIDAVEEINRDAEEKADGWPASLRKYPGGTATATTSYRTEISGTTLEEMMAWIEDLKSDGFEYQDFYDFGMTEEDMLGVGGWWAADGKIYISLSYQDGTVIVDHMTELPDMSSLLG